MSGRRVVLPLLLAAALGLIAFPGFFYFRDNFSTHYPVKVISARVFRAGQIPWWNFYDGGGQPLAGNPNTLTFYPDNVLYLILPAHAAFNLHFLLHLLVAWFAMRALCRQIGAGRGAATFAATMYAFSGLAISATAFYNLITAVALIPFALWAVESLFAADQPRIRHALIAGIAFGLIGLAGEPVIVISTAICAVIISAAGLTMRRAVLAVVAVVVAVIMVLPQIIAYAEIAGEVERAHGYSAATTLNASLLPRSVAEIAIGPMAGFLTDPGHPEFRARLFSTIFLGIVVVPALLLAITRRAVPRYLAIATVMVFIALGGYNPLVRAVVESEPALRVVRYPEKFAMALIVALVVIVAVFINTLPLKWRMAWGVITFVPLALVVVRATPIDWFAPYVEPALSRLEGRLCTTPPIAWGTRPARQEYREAARTMQPIFGAVAGVRYALNRSPEGMHSLMSRIVAERAASTPPAVRLRYQQISGCAVEGALPPAMIVPAAIGVTNVDEEVRAIESGRFDPHHAALAPARYAKVSSPASARIARYEERLQDIRLSVTTPAPALMFVNQSFFRAWSARAGDRELTTLPLDIDRLGVIVPAGSHEVILRFGRHRAAVIVAWIVSSIVIVVGLLALRVEIVDRRPREIERAADKDRALR